MTVQGQVKVKITTGAVTFRSTEQYLCPDLLRLENIGAADNARGKIVRAFFRILDVILPVK